MLRNKKFVRWTIILAAAALVTVNVLFVGIDIWSIAPAVRFTQDTRLSPDGTNGRFAMAMDLATGYFTVSDGLSKTEYTSYPREIDTDDEMKSLSKYRIMSMMEITLLDVKTKTLSTVNSTRNSVDNGGLTIEKDGTGYSMRYVFAEEKIEIPVRLNVTDQGFYISMNPVEIVESEAIKVMDISFMPFFLSADSSDGSNGYLLIPDGSGAIIDFQSNMPQWIRYSQKVYDKDSSLYKVSDVEVSQGIRMPVFGAKNAKGVVLGIITQGAADAYIVANTDEERTTYLNVCPQFVFREKDKIVYDDNRADVDLYQASPIYLDALRVDYLLESGEQKTYADMAMLYRGYLMNRYEMDKPQEPESTPLFVELYGSTIKKKQYAGVPLDAAYVLTTYGQAGEMLKKLHESDIGNVIVQYYNMSEESTWGKIPRGFTPMRKLGGRKSLTDFLALASDYGYPVYGNTDLSSYLHGSTIFSTFYETAKNMRKEPVNLVVFKSNTYVEDTGAATRLAITNARIGPYAGELIGAVSRYDMGVGISGHNELFRDFRNDGTTLTATLEASRAALDLFRKSGAGMVTNGGYEYELEYSSAIFSAPSSDSEYDLTTSGVPFLQIAMHGLIPYSLEAVNSVPDTEQLFLRSIETGASLLYRWTYEPSDTARYSADSDLYYSDYQKWVDDAVAKQLEIAALMKGKENQFITGHQKLAEGVYATTYEDADTIIVNYGDVLYPSEYGTVPANGYLVVQGGIA
ncbi:MAG: DUF5696 domain-containing protein [Saccharofermentanales bacterium]